ncbi:DUF1287 domain-containing protein [Heliobacterium chlorum]|nr:DUF1287 domain-containing protein [Heliobacterium chlorum]
MQKGRPHVAVLAIGIFTVFALAIGWLKTANPQLAGRMLGGIIELGSGLLSQSRLPFQPKVDVSLVLSGQDRDRDGLDDSLDIAAGARSEVDRKPIYQSNYYVGGYPPDTEGVCTDVVWRAFRDAGYDLKALVDEDIRKNPRAYPRVAMRPDPNIDFRRVPNLVVFFKRYGQMLTTDVVSGDAANLVEWQPGDIVVFGLGTSLEHIGVVSDRRRSDGIPLVIHNSGPTPREENALVLWPAKIDYHFRYIKNSPLLP